MNIAVWCGSNDGVAQVYRDAAADLGRWIAESGHTLVFGASNTGLMGALSRAALEAKGEVHGVSVRIPFIEEKASRNLASLEVLPTMAERKARMIALADAMIALPGGPGTLDEVTDCLVLDRLGLRNMPAILFNVNGYYDSLAAFFRRMHAEGFANDEMNLVHVCDSVADIARALAGFEARGGAPK